MHTYLTSCCSKNIKFYHLLKFNWLPKISIISRLIKSRQLFSAEGNICVINELQSPQPYDYDAQRVRYNKFSTGVVQFTLFIAADDESYRLPLHVRNTTIKYT